jgi:hypothetical protein
MTSRAVLPAWPLRSTEAVAVAIKMKMDKDNNFIIDSSWNMIDGITQEAFVWAAK